MSPTALLIILVEFVIIVSSESANQEDTKKTGLGNENISGTSMTPNDTQWEGTDNAGDISKKALFSKKRHKQNFDSYNLRYLNNAAHDDNNEGRRPSDRYHQKDFPVRNSKKKKIRTFIPAQKERKPNIILILTDDQDVELGSLNFMPRTLKLLRDGGAEFRHAYVTTPMCCPSRSSLLTGLYVHNHNVYTNNENCSGLHWQQTHETRTFATYLSNVGYRTGYFGKYLNKYNGTYVPPGWREWGGLIMNSRYYNYSINLNGRRVKHGDDYGKDYYTDLIANDSVSFLRQSKQYFSRKPVMLVLSFPAPHGPEDSAPQFSNMFFNVTTHHTPSYDFAPNPDKQWILQVTNRMQDIHKQFTDMLMTKRLQTLQSVDVAVERIYQELKSMGELENTYIVYTSDHGYHLGQFGLVKGKSFPFEFDVRVPFLVLGPGIQPGTVVEDLVLNIDLAPTFLEMAGVPPPLHMDGRSFLRLLQPPRGRSRRWPDTFLIESSGRRENTLMNLTTINRNRDGKLLEREDEVNEDDDEGEEDNEEDSQLDNKIPGPPRDSPIMDCSKPELQFPCKTGQKWYCAYENQKWRKYKCRHQQCACFTNSGFIYHKNNPFREGDHSRGKRSITDNKMSENLVPLLLNRRKRDSLIDGDHHISEVIKDLSGELENSEIMLGNTSVNQCLVLSNGLVSCHKVVYANLSIWQKMRQSVEKEIKLLKFQLESLKSIRRHLKENRPKGGRFRGTSLSPDLSTTEDTIGKSAVTTSSFIFGSTFISSEEDTSEDSLLAGGQSTSEKSWTNQIDNGVLEKKESDACYCAPEFSGSSRNKADREGRRRMKEEKLRKKERKSKKKAKMEKECLSEKMNCFAHDNQHWRTPPLWTEGPFCFCMNANNNTYSCLRTINSTHNFLYCEFITGQTTYYNIRIDPFEQSNRYSVLSQGERDQLSVQLKQLRECKGTKECTITRFN